MAWGMYLQSFFEFVFGNVATAVLVKELESFEHVLFLFELTQVHCGSQEFSIVNAVRNTDLISSGSSMLSKFRLLNQLSIVILAQ